ncbi:MAG: T9SS type A sorting domain-containing protein [bacterium]
MKLKLFCIVLIPVMLCAQVHTIPLGTRANTFVYTVKNSTSCPLDKLGVFVESFPEWIEFENNTVMIESLKPESFYEAEFHFNARSAKTGETGTVIVSLMDNTGKILSKKALTFCAVLKTNESRLHPPFPNPANPSTTVQFSLTEPAEVTITVFNIRGRAVKTLTDRYYTAGLWEIPWQGEDSYGQQVASGMYIIQLKTITEQNTRKWSVKVNLQH